MLESLDSYLVRRYLAELRKELVVGGIHGDRLGQVLAEAQVHLEESMAVAAPQSEQDVIRVIHQFGAAKAMARNLAAEVDRAASMRWHLWPAGFLVVAFAIFVSDVLNFTLFRGKSGTWDPSGIVIAGHRFFPSGLWIGTVFLVACAAVFFALGYRARRLLFAQFAFAAVGLIAVQTVWYSATSYPVAYGMHRRAEWYRPVPRSQANQLLASLRTDITRHFEIQRLVELGQTVFTASGSPARVPAGLMANGNYLLPEGVREVTIGIKPEEMHPSLLTSSWKDAVTKWTERRYGPNGTEADTIIARTPDETEYTQFSIDSLNWIRRQPLGTQIWTNVRMVATYTFALCAMAMLFNWGGWAFFNVVRFVRRVIRRSRYGRNELLTA